MNKKEIEELIKFVSKAGVSEVSLETKEIKITIKNTPGKAVDQAPVIVQAAPPVHAAPAQIQMPAAATQVNAPAPPASASAASGDDSKYVTIKSPMIGTFYRRSSPDKPNLVEVGDEVSPGTVVCIIEAMKLFNEIESEVKGKIVKILVEDASPVEYDQPLFLVEPN